jgi:excisionase family DNA binding protein
MVNQTLLDHIQTRLDAGETVKLTAVESSLSPQEAADYLNVSRAYILGKINAGVIHSTRRGTRHRIPLKEVERFRQWYTNETATILGEDL